jgi:hypothetical protein
LSTALQEGEVNAPVGIDRKRRFPRQKPAKARKCIVFFQPLGTLISLDWEEENNRQKRKMREPIRVEQKKTETTETQLKYRLSVRSPGSCSNLAAFMPM